MKLSRYGWLLALYQLIAGGFGLWNLAFHPVHASAYQMSLSLGVVCLYGACVLLFAAGVLLFVRPQLGKTLSIILQGMQIPILALGSIQYHLIVTLGFGLGFKPPSFLLFRSYLGRVEGSLLFGNFTNEGVFINFIAVFFFFLASKSLRKDSPDS